MDKDIVLCDDLFKLYIKFKKGLVTDRRELKVVQQMLSFFKPFLANKRQYDLANEKMLDGMSEQLAAIGILPNMSEIELAKKTRYKLILTKDTSLTAFPYLCIDGSDRIEKNYTGTFKNCLRSKCIEHLKALCKKAQCVEVFDKYLCEDENFSNGVIENFFCLFDSDCKTDVVVKLPLEADMFSRQSAKLAQWWSDNSTRFKVHMTHPQVDSGEDFHDRYMKINTQSGKIEVLLSSGFFYLFNSEKDFTYVVHAG